ncbi:MAG: helix-turn-helix domain-containing protein [Promethearchaeia archaeon]
MEEILDEILNELVSIRKILLLIAGPHLSSMLEEVLTTNERREMWQLMDGNHSTSEIAEEVGVTTRTVQLLVAELEEHDLVKLRKRGYPEREISSTLDVS